MNTPRPTPIESTLRTPATTPLRGDVQVRVDLTALILGQMWTKFLTAIHRILKSRVPKPNSGSSLDVVTLKQIVRK